MQKFLSGFEKIRAFSASFTSLSKVISHQLIHCNSQLFTLYAAFSNDSNRKTASDAELNWTEIIFSWIRQHLRHYTSVQFLTITSCDYLVAW